MNRSPDPSQLVDDISDDISVTSSDDAIYEADAEFVVEDLHSERYNARDGVLEYLVEWTNFPIDECTWEPESGLDKVLKQAWVRKKASQGPSVAEAFEGIFVKAFKRKLEERRVLHRRRNAKRSRLRLDVTRFTFRGHIYPDSEDEINRTGGTIDGYYGVSAGTADSAPVSAELECVNRNQTKNKDLTEAVPTGRTSDPMVSSTMALPYHGSDLPHYKRRKLTDDAHSPLKNDLLDRKEEEASYRHDTNQCRARENETMVSKFGGMAAPSRHRLVSLLDERAKLMAQLVQNKETYDAVEADTSQPSRQQHSRPDSLNSIPMTGKITTKPPNQEVNHVPYMKSVSRNDQPTRQIIEYANQHHINIDHHSQRSRQNQQTVNGKQLIHNLCINQSLDGHHTLSHEPHRYSSRTHDNSTRATLDNLHLTTLLQFLTATPPRLKSVITVPSLSSHNSKYFWWDVRRINECASFPSTITFLSGGATGVLLNRAIPVSSLPSATSLQDNPKTEAELQSILAAWLLPRLNTALRRSSSDALQLSVLSGTGLCATETTKHMFLATMARSTMGGGLCVCVVGLIKSSRRFRTSMRYSRHQSDKVDYLGGLAHLHCVMRQHACRYGFILTETELVIVRNGTERIPLFGLLEVARCQFATDAGNSIHLNGDEAEEGVGSSTVPIAPCLALWGLCMLASYSSHDSHVPSHTETGAGTRTKTVERDAWIPRLHAEEKRTAKLNRGWVLPTAPLTSMEKRGIGYPR